MKIIRIEHGELLEIEGLDFDLYDKFQTEEIEYINDKDIKVEGYPIEIGELIDYLTDLKNKGYNFTRLESHIDHIGYNIQGVKISEYEK